MHQQNDRYKIDSERTQRNRLATQHSTRADRLIYELYFATAGSQQSNTQ